jgi:hypothetical protein
LRWGIGFIDWLNAFVVAITLGSFREQLARNDEQSYRTPNDGEENDNHRDAVTEGWECVSRNATESHKQHEAAGKCEGSAAMPARSSARSEEVPSRHRDSRFDSRHSIAGSDKQSIR